MNPGIFDPKKQALANLITMRTEQAYKLFDIQIEELVKWGKRAHKHDFFELCSNPSPSSHSPGPFVGTLRCAEPVALGIELLNENSI